MPGRPLTELFPEVENAEEPVLRVATYGARNFDEGAMRARKVRADDEQLQLLKSLGYIK
jgi:hypothetical protein